MPDIIGTPFAVEPPTADTVGGVPRVSRRRDLFSGSQHQQNGKKKEQRRNDQEANNSANESDTHEEAYPPGFDKLLSALADTGLDFVLAGNSSGQALELRGKNTQATVLRIPPENPHELSGGGILLKQSY